MPFTDADYCDMQGLLRFGYAGLTEACFLLLQIEDAVAAGNWLGSAPVATAEVQDPPPVRALQIALTCEGLRKLGLPDDLLNGFSAEFLSGMSGDENRSRRLGDVGANASEYWQWGGGVGDVPDLVALLYAKPGLFDEWKGSIEAGLMRSGFKLLQCLPTSDMGGVEPFGFVDGVSQPTVDWEGRRDASGDQLNYTNLSMLGEFVLGYPNEYGKYTTRPVIPGHETGGLPAAEDLEGHSDLGRNGTYLVIRQIEQDVRGFWQFLDKQVNEDASKRQALAEKMVGRQMSGDSLLPATGQSIAGVGPDPQDIQRNQFTFDGDVDGIHCPFGAHVRRANPRNADYPAGTHDLLERLIRLLGFGRKSIRDDMVASTRFHRLLRRGREYGTKLSPDERLQPQPASEAPSGLLFVCLNANISRQFEFIQNAWLMSGKFDGLNEEGDPLLGNREPVAGCPVNKFSVPVADGVRQQIQGLPPFTTIRGGAYFFLPGVRALRYLARIAKFD
jgi:deferrochelatase/peroxidase EfeB